ncbi:Gfo/Idh/MocA family protein [Aeromicrobium choanae]|uniref:Predicted dehydrogenase n=1 Tax=Aeromicrobium choanae TaxID=1736691 RepID=A0A1T4Z2Q2_9ACTN|nr:Gfo/Idh/MocA family oxidoreductase [Aeromicrobium choanae]SKB08314.1 Predicted dehydrogenase [Aeromicrobium choanae]
MTTSFAPVRWAVAGWGVGGRVFHAPLIRSADGMDLVAVVSTNPDRGREARAEALEVMEDLASLREAGVEGVTITTPAGTHADLAVEALELGLHVVVDKPFATTAHDARRIVAAASGDTVLTVYQNRRWDGDFLTLEQLVRDGELGRVDRLESRIERFRPDLPRWTRDRDSQAGGGVLVDLGPHLIDQAVHLLGPVRQVLGDLSTLGEDRLSEDDAILMLRHDSGARSTIVASVHAAAEGPRFRVSGTRGGLRIEGFDPQEDQLFAGESPRSSGARWGEDDPGRTVWLEGPDGAGRRAMDRGRWDTFYPAVASAIRTGSAVPVPASDAVHVAAIFDAARLSAAQDRWVDVAPNAKN